MASSSAKRMAGGHPADAAAAINMQSLVRQGTGHESALSALCKRPRGRAQNDAPDRSAMAARGSSGLRASFKT
jgi:hypothetical protein